MLLHYGSFMYLPRARSRIVRFGVFEVDFAAEELRKNGVKLRLQGQPFRILALLLERAGEIVTREELRQKLWTSDTFVDFDHSLNTAVNKIRDTLGDSASSPRYIETLARKGYRFLAPVERDAEAKINAEPGATRAPENEKLPSEPSAAIDPDLQVPIPHRGVTRGLFVLIQIMYLCFYVPALLHIHGVQGVANLLLSSRWSLVAVAVVMITAGIGIPLRFYLISAAGFDYQRLNEKFRRIFPFVLALDQLWALSPFLLFPQIGIGAAFAACAALLYVPFSERTLIRMAYPVRPAAVAR